MDTNVFEHGQQNFNLPHDVVQLPSGGVFYNSKKKSVKVGYLTANDENILTNISSTNDVVLNILRNKIYEHDIRPDELIDSDIEAILIFLRNTAFGPEYSIQLEDPTTGKKFTTTVNIDELNFTKPEHKPDENGFFITKLPKSGYSVKIRPLSFYDNIEISKMRDSYPENITPPVVTWRLMKQIVEIDGDSSKEKISNFVNVMPMMDSKHIRKFLNDNVPSLDLEKRVKAPSGEFVTFRVTLGVEFFRPFF